MTDVLARAQALRDLVASGAALTSPRAVVEAAVSCASELLKAGESNLAKELIDSIYSRANVHPNDWGAPLEILRVRVLLATDCFEPALRAIRDFLENPEQMAAWQPSERYRLRTLEGYALWALNRPGEAIEKLMKIRAELLARPDSSELALCSHHLSAALMIGGDYHAARKMAHDAIVSARRSSDPFLEAVTSDNLGRLDRSFCRWATSQEASENALRLFEKEGYRTQASNARRGLAILFWKRGHLDEALGLGKTSTQESFALGQVFYGWYGRLLQGMVLLHKGDFPGAMSHLAEKPSFDLPYTESRVFLLSTEFLGDIHLEQGEAEQALKHYDEVWPKALALVPKGDIVAELRRRRAECYLLMGHAEQAYEEAKAGLEHCRELGDRYEEAATYRVLALSAAAVNKPAEAKRWFEQGFAYYDDIETPYEWGKLWLAYGDWLSGPLAAEFTDRRGAREAYEAARDHFERMGAQARLAEAKARIARLAPPQSAVADAPPRRPLRRPREQREADARSRWALETFGTVTRSRQMLTILDTVAQLARSTAPVLILGESGTGKELIAKAIHRLSGRKGAFMPINCAALPREIIESELFGHMAGAFTGATRDKPGLLETCDGGTVLLDEVAEMPQELQSRLLRYLETGEVRRVGANRHTTVSTRVVAATNQDRATLEKGGGFRTDLYYRLAHAIVTLPPLRRRGDDVAYLIEHFLAEANREEGKRVDFSDVAFDRLVAYTWPGNVRQMRAVIRRTVILAHDGHAIGPEALDLSDDTQVATTLLEELEQAEKRRLEEALQNARGSRTEAARMLGMPRTSLLSKMRRYGLAK